MKPLHEPGPDYPAKVPSVKSPWVIEVASEAERRLWLGPCLALLEVPRDLDLLDASARQTLAAQGFVRPQVKAPALPASTVGARVLIVDPPCEEAEVSQLLASLARNVGGQWTFGSWPSVTVAKTQPDIVVYFGAREDAEALARYVSLAKIVVIAGESTEGPHVGPCLRGPADLAAYVEASRDWAASVALAITLVALNRDLLDLTHEPNSPLVDELVVSDWTVLDSPL